MFILRHSPAGADEYGEQWAEETIRPVRQNDIQLNNRIRHFH